MKHRPIIIAATILGLTALASRAGAAVIVTDGTLHLEDRTAGIVLGDLPFVSPQTSASRDYTVRVFNPLHYGYDSHVGHVEESVSFFDTEIEISAVTTRGGSFSAESFGSGNLNITEDAAETMRISIVQAPVGPPSRGEWSLDAVGGGNVFDRKFATLGLNRLPFDFLAPVPPGQYTLTWSGEGGGGGGYGGFRFNMILPEPWELLIITAAGAPVFLRRRGRQR